MLRLVFVFYFFLLGGEFPTMYRKSSVGLGRSFFLKSESVFGVCLVHGKKNGNDMSMEVIPEK